MKNVLLVGDSIRLGYQEKVEKLLGDKVKIYAPGENCRFTKFALWGMFSWVEGFGCTDFDAAHWNTGAWDLHRVTADGEIFTPIDDYVRDSCRMATQLRSYTDKLCFATITPGGKGLDETTTVNALINTNSDFPKMPIVAPMEIWNNDVKRYNNAVVPELKKMGVRINDLYATVMSDPEKYICDDGVHMTDEGYSALARNVADNILEMIG